MASLLFLTKKGFSPLIFRPPLLPRFFSSTITSENTDPETQHFKVDQYLVSSLGFPPTKAASIAKIIAHLKSPQKPDAVRRFLEQQTFDQAQIKTIIAGCPSILCSSVENTLNPNLRALRAIGLSPSALNQIILSDSAVLQRSEAVPRINFWRDFIGGEEADVVKVFKKNRGLICCDVTGGIPTKISLLQGYGIPIQDIRYIICSARGFITHSVFVIEDLLKRTKELGFQPQSRMFKHGLMGMKSLSREALQKKKELYKSFGWSENDLLSAVQKTPNILRLSEENIREKMDFFTGEVGLDLSYITFRPTLLPRSLEKRLRPRHNVLQLLESKNLILKRKVFLSAMIASESTFAEKYIYPHNEVISELHQAYLTWCASGSGVAKSEE